jgi:hypothetical protein
MQLRVFTPATLAILLVPISTAPVACARQPDDGTPSILHAKGETVRVRLLDASSGRPIANADVELSSDNGIRCVQAPCPTNGKEWRGRSDAAGQVMIPTSTLQAVTSITTPGHHGDLIEDSEPADSGGWVAELFPRDYAESDTHPVKLIDSRSNKAIVDAPVLVEFRTNAGKLDSLRTATNALGYIFVPFRVVALAAEHTWVVVPGYRRAGLDFAWARRKTKLERL